MHQEWIFRAMAGITAVDVPRQQARLPTLRPLSVNILRSFALAFTSKAPSSLAIGLRHRSKCAGTVSYRDVLPDALRPGRAAQSHIRIKGARVHASQEEVLSSTRNGAVATPVASTSQNGLGWMDTAIFPSDGNAR